MGYIDGTAADVVVDGRELEVEGDGFFVGPTLLDGVTPEMDVYRDEIFGPVLAVVRVETLADAIELINANPYANGTAIFTGSGQAARYFQRQVHVGMIGINVPIPVPMAFYSFGGWKASLFGDTHVHGPEGINFYTRGKVVTSRWPEDARDALEHALPDRDMSVGVGVIGAGMMGADHVRTLTGAVDGAHVAAVADADPARAEAAAGLGGGRAFADPHALIADPEVDRVVVASYDATPRGVRARVHRGRQAGAVREAARDHRRGVPAHPRRGGRRPAAGS